MDLLRQLQREWNVRAVEEMPRTPSEMGEENQARRELAGGIATALGTWGSRTTTQDWTTCRTRMPHPWSTPRDCLFTLCRDIQTAGHAQVKPGCSGLMPDHGRAMPSARADLWADPRNASPWLPIFPANVILRRRGGLQGPKASTTCTLLLPELELAMVYSSRALRARVTSFLQNPETRRKVSSWQQKAWKGILILVCLMACEQCWDFQNTNWARFAIIMGKLGKLFTLADNCSLFEELCTLPSIPY